MLIAAFICTHSYDASAAVVDCSNIKNLSEAQQCYKDWNRNFTYEGWKAELELHPNIEGINFCGSWNGDIDEDTGEQYLHNTCIDVIPEELANYCCNLKSNGGTSCEYVVLGWDTCESTDTGGDTGGDTVVEIWECSTDEQAAERYDENSRIITSVTEQFPSGVGYAPSDFDKFELDTRYLCKENWDGSECDDGNPDSNDGGLMSCARCYEPDIDKLVSRACDQNANEPDICRQIYAGTIKCDAVLDPCPPGEYMDQKYGFAPLFFGKSAG